MSGRRGADGKLFPYYDPESNKYPDRKFYTGRWMTTRQISESNAWQRQHRKTTKGKAVATKYKQSPKGRAARARYDKSPKRKAVMARYCESPNGREARETYRKSPSGRAAMKRANDNSPNVRMFGTVTRVPAPFVEIARAMRDQRKQEAKRNG